MIKKLIFIQFLFFGIVATAQIPKDEIVADYSIFPKETVALSMSSNVFLAGESLQYKAYIRDASNKKSLLSTMVYVSLRNQKDSLIFDHKLKIENGMANGDFFIPSNLKTGVYKLIGYTNFSRNNATDAFVQKDIFIINTFEKNGAISKMGDTIFMNHSVKKDFKFSENDNSTKLRIGLDKEVYGPREKVILNLESTLESIEGNYLLSVRKINPLEISGKIPTSSKAFSSDVFYVPELRGELISGVVLSKVDSNAVANKEVALTIPGKDYVFKVAKTNNNGRFFFSVPENYNTDNSIIQLFGNEADRNAYSVVLDKKDFPLNQREPYFLKLDANLKDWLQERSVQIQVDNAYFDIKKDSLLATESNPAFYENLGTVFILDDYTRFSSVRETFVEVITLAAIRGTGDNAKFIVNNEYDPNRTAKFNDIAPLVLMDGILIQDNSELINYSARDIENIRVINMPYRYGSKIYSGIISVKTKKGDFVPKVTNNYIEEISLPPVVGPKKYYSPDYGNKAKLSRIPDYRVQLLWEPNVNLRGVPYQTVFYTSDVPGIYEIFVEGFSENGTYFISKKYFKINED